MIKFAPGHTPGHQMLLLRLKNTGPVLLSEDLYHFPQERTLNRFPVYEFDKEQTRHSRMEMAIVGHERAATIESASTYSPWNCRFLFRVY